MVNQKLRNAIIKYAEENDYLDTIAFLDNESYDNSIVGVSSDGRVVYDYNKMVQEYAEDNECDEIDAIEWIDYNTMRAIPYMGDCAPIILMETPDSLLERYGD